MMARKRVLIVDDDEAIREIAGVILQTMTPWEALTAASGKEALVIACEQLPDAILLDMIMPDLNGIETLKLIRENKATHSIPVIFLTAKTFNQDKQASDALSIAGTIAKPLNGLELVQQIRLLLQWE